MYKDDIFWLGFFIFIGTTIILSIVLGRGCYIQELENDLKIAETAMQNGYEQIVVDPPRENSKVIWVKKEADGEERVVSDYLIDEYNDEYYSNGVNKLGGK